MTFKRGGILINLYFSTVLLPDWIFLSVNDVSETDKRLSTTYLSCVLKRKAGKILIVIENKR